MENWKGFLIELAKKLTPILAFVVLIVLLVAWFGARVPPIFQALIYIVVIGGMLIFVLQSILAELAKRKRENENLIKETKDTGPTPSGEQNHPSLPLLSEEVARKSYLEAIIADCRALRLVGLDPQAADPSRGGLSLEALYVSLDTTTQIQEQSKSKKSRKDKVVDLLEKESRPLSALEALIQSPKHKIVLLGLPGTGKSTFVRYLALRMAQVMNDSTTDLESLLPSWKEKPVLPVIVSLGRLAESTAFEGTKADAAIIERFLTASLEADNRLAGFAPYFFQVLTQEGCLVLFDGLDEVADLKLRARAVQAIESFADKYRANPASRFLVTCRTYSYYHDTQWQLTGWPTYELALLDESKIHQFVSAWHAEHIRIDPARRADYERKQNKLMEALQPGDRRQLLDIAPFPIILTMMAVVHTHYGDLPDTRAQVYEKCTDLLLVRWELERPVVSGEVQKQSIVDALGVLRGTLDSALWEVAYRAHEGRDEIGDKNAALVTEDLLSGVLQIYLQDPQKVSTFLEYCQSANGLLMLQGTVSLPDAPPNSPMRRVYAFPHLTFEEYLAGRHLEGPNLGKRVREHIDRSDRWREVVLLLGEYLCFERQDVERMDSILKFLVPDRLPLEMKDNDWRAIWLAGDLLLLYRRIFREKSPSDERIATGLRSLVERGALELRTRAAVADTLDELGWLPPDLSQFVYVSPKESKASGKRISSTTPSPFYIARYPVTNAQYVRFLRAPDFPDEELWRGFAKFNENSKEMKGIDWGEAGWKWLQSNWDEDRCVLPRLWSDPRFGITRRGAPVVGITWYEANAYCRWLQRHWDELPEGSDNPGLHPGLVRLPTEVEWVMAAGGSEPEDRYPWDQAGQNTTEVARIIERANVDEAGIGKTTPVGMFPLGQSQPYGLWDMAGNVFEWQANFYEKDRERLALRGGAWYYSREFARVAFRYPSPPDYVWSNDGFRVVAFPR